MKKAEATRLNILKKAFDLVYVKGYQATSVDDILATTLVTKGAFYYHFKNKDEMGLAIINELLRPAFQHDFLEPLQTAEDPLKAIYNMMYHILIEDEFLKIEYGCPAANLTQEMAPWNASFTAALSHLTKELMENMISSIERGKKNGFVAAHVNAQQVAVFVMSGYWGIRNMGKLTNSKSVYAVYLKELESFLETMK